ncbi:MAG: hypothetical protein HXX80_01735 [Nitrososphaerales archaeon]|nr:hypothetical protein [Nitrososphaerales archaeon]
MRRTLTALRSKVDELSDVVKLGIVGRESAREKAMSDIAMGVSLEERLKNIELMLGLREEIS